jgi:Sec7-like guanine-nucleotide exchange factor
MGEFFGNISMFNQEVLELFLLKINFGGMTLDQAIRSLVRVFRLPGEAQQIDRILEKFASVYFKQNNDSSSGNGTHNSAIKSASVAYVLSFSILMLNTDLHNSSVAHKEKMTLEEFIRNNRGINDGIDVPREHLEILYLRVKNEEIKMDVADMLESNVSG